MEIDFKITHSEEQECLDKGYKYLGWQVYSGNCEELKKCQELGHIGHTGQENVRVFHTQHSPRGSDCTYWCTECKLFWKIDMSD